MKVQMKTIMCGPDGTGHPGQVVDVDDDRAIALVEGGYAEFIEEAKEAVLPAETAEAPEPEGAADQPPPPETAEAPHAFETAEAPETRRGRKGR